MRDDCHILNVYNEVIDKYAKKPKLFDVFLSHKQSEAQDRAKVYKCYLQNKGYKCFYDRDELTDADWSPEKVIELVAGSRSLIVFITPTYLDSSWCQWEIYIALKAKIPIILLMVDPWPNKTIIFEKLSIPKCIRGAFQETPVKDNRYDLDNTITQIIKKLNRHKISSRRNKTLKKK